ncbi:hypothetical protein [Butyrivibrio sp. NC3005]|uniref:hypothetical protein n=1 Tax=Butyrivibrio sp. NC3005 TaxID=1280685 RepID=UPI00040E75B5|nr:hypothetical protein [Butyrivibrio sp. NC3005]
METNTAKMNKIQKIKNELTRKNRINQFLIGLVSTFCLFFRNDLAEVFLSNKNSVQADLIMGFVTGLSIAFMLVCVYNIAKNTRAMKDEASLTKIYNELNDERMKQIEALSGKRTVEIAAISFLVLAFIVGIFSFEGAVVLVAATFIICIINKISFIYYTNTFTGQE